MPSSHTRISLFGSWLKFLDLSFLLTRLWEAVNKWLGEPDSLHPHGRPRLCKLSLGHQVHRGTELVDGSSLSLLVSLPPKYI